MATRFDLVVVGGGFQGAFLALEASRRGMSVLLLEKRSVGQGTSDQSLRVVHGGFRYLQSLDFTRYRVSQREQRWFLENLPDLVRPLQCVLPLDGEGLRRPNVARVACLVDAAMGDSPVPRARVLSRSECATTLGFQTPNAVGGLEWHDAVVDSGAAAVRAITRWAQALGAQAVEGATVTTLAVQGGMVRGVRGSVNADAHAVIVAAGGANVELAAQLAGLPSKDSPLARRVVGYNVVVQRSPHFRGGFGFRSRGPGSSTFFCLPRGEQMVLGTLYAPVKETGDVAGPPDEAVAQLLTHANHSIPGCRLDPADVVGYDVGVMPALSDGRTPSDRPVVVHAPSQGGPQNLWFVAPEKFTTTRAMAENLLQRVFGTSLPLLPGTERPTLRETTVGEASWAT